MFNLVGNAISGFKDIVRSFKIPPEEKAKIDAELVKLEVQLKSETLEYEKTLFTEASKTVRAEIASKSWMARNWRPITMFTFLFMIVLHWFGQTPENITDEQVSDLMGVIQIALTGYVIGRSAEKIIPNSKWGR